jgi:hypothetical protein
MAVRLNKRQTENSRAAIQTTQILKRLQNHVLGELELTQTQIAAARILLNKSMPDLQAVTHSGEVEHQVKLSVTLTPHGR